MCTFFRSPLPVSVTARGRRRTGRRSRCRRARPASAARGPASRPPASSCPSGPSCGLSLRAGQRSRDREVYGGHSPCNRSPSPVTSHRPVALSSSRAASSAREPRRSWRRGIDRAPPSTAGCAFRASSSAASRSRRTSPRGRSPAAFDSTTTHLRGVQALSFSRNSLAICGGAPAEEEVDRAGGVVELHEADAIFQVQLQHHVAHLAGQRNDLVEGARIGQHAGRRHTVGRSRRPRSA